MDETFHTFSELFAQLGLPTEKGAIDAIIASHRPLPADMLLADAPFWEPAQAQFLREQLRADADWAEKVDELNLALHEH